MPGDRPEREPLSIPTLIEAGPWVLNVWYMISAQQVGIPDRRAEVQVTMETGEKIQLKGEAAEQLLGGIERLLPERSTPSVVTRTKVVRGHGGKPG